MNPFKEFIPIATTSEGQTLFSGDLILLYHNMCGIPSDLVKWGQVFYNILEHQYSSGEQKKTLLCDDKKYISKHKPGSHRRPRNLLRDRVYMYYLVTSFDSDFSSLWKKIEPMYPISSFDGQCTRIENGLSVPGIKLVAFLEELIETQSLSFLENSHKKMCFARLFLNAFLDDLSYLNTDPMLCESTFVFLVFAPQKNKYNENSKQVIALHSTLRETFRPQLDYIADILKGETPSAPIVENSEHDPEVEFLYHTYRTEMKFPTVQPNALSIYREIAGMYERYQVHDNDTKAADDIAGYLQFCTEHVLAKKTPHPGFFDDFLLMTHFRAENLNTVILHKLLSLNLSKWDDQHTTVFEPLFSFWNNIQDRDRNFLSIPFLQTTKTSCLPSDMTDFFHRFFCTNVEFLRFFPLEDKNNFVITEDHFTLNSITNQIKIILTKHHKQITRTKLQRATRNIIAEFGKALMRCEDLRSSNIDYALRVAQIRKNLEQDGSGASEEIVLEFVRIFKSGLVKPARVAATRALKEFVPEAIFNKCSGPIKELLTETDWTGRLIQLHDIENKLPSDNSEKYFLNFLIQTFAFDEVFKRTSYPHTYNAWRVNNINNVWDDLSISGTLDEIESKMEQGQKLTDFLHRILIMSWEDILQLCVYVLNDGFVNASNYFKRNGNIDIKTFLVNYTVHRLQKRVLHADTDQPTIALINAFIMAAVDAIARKREKSHTAFVEMCAPPPMVQRDKQAGIGLFAPNQFFQKWADIGQKILKAKDHTVNDTTSAESCMWYIDNSYSHVSSFWTGIPYLLQRAEGNVNLRDHLRSLDNASDFTYLQYEAEMMMLAAVQFAWENDTSYEEFVLMKEFCTRHWTYINEVDIETTFQKYEALYKNVPQGVQNVPWQEDPIDFRTQAGTRLWDVHLGNVDDAVAKLQSAQFLVKRRMAYVEEQLRANSLFHQENEGHGNCFWYALGYSDMDMYKVKAKMIEKVIQLSKIEGGECVWVDEEGKKTGFDKPKDVFPFLFDYNQWAENTLAAMYTNVTQRPLLVITINSFTWQDKFVDGAVQPWTGRVQIQVHVPSASGVTIPGDFVYVSPFEQDWMKLLTMMLDPKVGGHVIVHKTAHYTRIHNDKNQPGVMPSGQQGNRDISLLQFKDDEIFKKLGGVVNDPKNIRVQPNRAAKKPSTKKAPTLATQNNAKPRTRSTKKK